jgi:hypothetical protein
MAGKVSLRLERVAALRTDKPIPIITIVHPLLLHLAADADADFTFAAFPAVVGCWVMAQVRSSSCCT